jgi:F0F1-type ATP synthase delta subunit
MTGVLEAGTVIGLISGVISIIEATKTVYDTAKDAKGQPKAFCQVAARLPIVNEILQSAKQRTQTLDESAMEALKPILKSCKVKAEDLEKLFQEVIRKDDDKWYDRYKKIVGILGKGGRVEGLMEEILKDIQVLACERLTGTATDTQMKELEEAIKEMNDMPSSLPDEAGSFIQTHSGSGDNIGHTGGTMNIHKGRGDLYHNVISGGATFGGKK